MKGVRTIRYNHYRNILGRQRYTGTDLAYYDRHRNSCSLSLATTATIAQRRPQRQMRETRHNFPAKHIVPFSKNASI